MQIKYDNDQGMDKKSEDREDDTERAYEMEQEMMGQEGPSPEAKVYLMQEKKRVEPLQPILPMPAKKTKKKQSI